MSSARFQPVADPAAYVPSVGRTIPHDSAAPLAVGVIAEFLGVPRDLGPQLLAWSHDMVAIYQVRRDRAIEDRAVAATVEFSALMREFVAARRREPQVALRVLFERLPGLKIEEPPRVKDAWHVRGLEALRVVW